MACSYCSSKRAVAPHSLHLNSPLRGRFPDTTPAGATSPVPEIIWSRRFLASSVLGKVALVGGAANSRRWPRGVDGGTSAICVCRARRGQKEFGWETRFFLQEFRVAPKAMPSQAWRRDAVVSRVGAESLRFTAPEPNLVSATVRVRRLIRDAFKVRPSLRTRVVAARHRRAHERETLTA